MIVLFLIVVVLLCGLVAVTYLLGFRIGSSHWQEELLRVRGEAMAATRQMHELTRQAFQAMAEEADRHRRPR